MVICGRRGWLAALLLVGMLSPANADDCRVARTQADLDQCAGDSFAAADKTLNSTYKSVMDRLSGQDDARKLLIGAQKAWLAFRDAECDFKASGSAGGSVYPMIAAQCKAQETRARTEALRHLLTCAEGDLACPLPPR